MRRAHARGQILHEAIEQQGTAGGVRQVGELDDSFRQRIKASLRAGVDRLTAPTPVEQARIAADLAIYLHDFAGEGFQEDVPVFTATPELQKRWGQGKDDPPPAPQPGSLFAIVEALEKLIWVTSARAKEGPGPFEATVTIRSAYPPGEAEKYSAHLTFKDAAPCGVAPSFVWQWDEPNPRDA